MEEAKQILREYKQAPLEELTTYLESNLKDENTILQEIAIRKYAFKKMKLKLKLELNNLHHQIKIINDSSYQDNHPKIYACTACDISDILVAYSIIKEPAWLSLRKSDKPYPFEEYLLRHFFVTWYNSTTESLILDRQRNILLNGGNIILFPETTIVPNIISPLNEELSKLVITTDASIIPISITTVKEKDLVSYVTIGRNFELQGLRPEYEKDLLCVFHKEFCDLKNITLEHLLNIPPSSNEEVSKRHLLIKK